MWNKVQETVSYLQKIGFGKADYGIILGTGLGSLVDDISIELSIAYADMGGGLQVGPESAGASPGPACYGVGDQPTVTDANLFLKRLAPTYFLDGRLAIDSTRSQGAIEGLAASAAALRCAAAKMPDSQPLRS